MCSGTDAPGNRGRPGTASNGFCLVYPPVFQAFFDNKNQMLRLYKAGLSGQILDVLKEYFHFDEIPDRVVNDGDGDGASGTGETINMEKYRMAYRTGGIYSCLLLWFSHDMRETPEEMTEIAVSL